MIVLLSIIILLAAVLVTVGLLPIFLKIADAWALTKEAKFNRQMDQMFYTKSAKGIVRLYFILPVILGLAGFLLTRSLIVAVPLAFVGLVVPNFIIKMRLASRKRKFNSQLLDAIGMLSSCLKGGLSLLQGFEVLVEEMPPPMSDELGLVVRENKMGITLEESLVRLNMRMELEELGLIINALLVSRETGGELTKVFSRLAITIRDNRKLKESITTLTLQGRLQGAVMSFLPIAFVLWVLSTNRHHFDIMLNNDIGKLLLVTAVILQVVGMFLIRKFSTIKI
jgi:tight adherence protein B